MGDIFTNFNKVPTVFGNSEFSLCLEPYKLYEAILITKWPSTKSNFNSAAMGVRFLDEYTLVINPYPETDTFNILKNASVANIRHKLSINFTDNVVLFAKSALTGLNSGYSVSELNEDEIIHNNDVALLSDAKSAILGEVITEFKDMNLDFSDEFSEFLDKGYAVKTKFNARFEVNIRAKYRSSKMFQPTNRGDNLAIEAIILASKLPPIIKTADLNRNNEENKLFKMVDRIREYQKEIRRFSTNKKALEVCIIIDSFISDFL